MVSGKNKVGFLNPRKPEGQKYKLLEGMHIVFGIPDI
jgi:hypothetical protein